MDEIGLFIARLHGMLGHDTAAAFIGQPSGDKSACTLCRYERHPTDANRAAVLAALAASS